jgi:hypothetical protein
MKAYRSSEVFGKLKAARNRFARMLAADIPPTVRKQVEAAENRIIKAIAEYDFLRELKLKSRDST